jgi:enoyl-CoA hydratase/carnithine racemase
MMSSRGTGSDPITALMNIIGDPEGMTKRLKELKEETDKYNAAFEKAQTRAAEAEERDLVSRKNEEALTKRSAELDALSKLLNGQQVSIEAGKKKLEIDSGELTVRQFNVTVEQDRRATELNDLAANLTKRANELDRIEKDQKDRIRVVEAKLEGIDKREADLVRREAAFVERQAKLRELLG